MKLKSSYGQHQRYEYRRPQFSFCGADQGRIVFKCGREPAVCSLTNGIQTFSQSTPAAGKHRTCRHRKEGLGWLNILRHGSAIEAAGHFLERLQIVTDAPDQEVGISPPADGGISVDE